MLCLTRNHAARPFDGLDRIFDEMSRGFATGAPYAADAYHAPLDVSETAGQWRVETELPGVAPQDVEVTVAENVLTIRGEKKNVAKPEGESLRRDERRYGKFVRTLEFPGVVDAGKVAARFVNGLLVVTLGKADESKPRTIAVKIE